MAGEQYDPIFQAAGAQYGIDPLLLKAQALRESSLNPDAVGPDTPYGKAVGISQMLPQTAKALGVDPSDPESAIRGQAKLMAENLKRYGSPEGALLAYHGGTNQDNWGPKTQDYAQKVMAQYQQLSAQMPADQPQEQQAQYSEAATKLLNVLGSGDQTAATTAAPEQQYSPAASKLLDVLNGKAPPEQSTSQAAITSQASPAQASPPPVTGMPTTGINGWISKNIQMPIGAGLNRGVRDVLDTGAEAIGPYVEPYAQKAASALGLDPKSDFFNAKQLDDKQRSEYAQSYGDSGLAAGSRFVGNVGGISAANAAITPYLAAALPGAAETFLSGAGGAVSKVANAAMQGAAGNAMLSSTSDAPIGDQMTSGALWGAGLRTFLGAGGAAAQKLFSSPAAEEEIAPVVQKGMDAIRKFGVDSPQVAENPALQQFTQTQLQRIADYEKAGIKNYTIGDITRTFGDQQFERETAKNVAAGAPLREAMTAKNADLIKAVEGAVEKTGGDADAFAGGQSMKGALSQGEATLDGKIQSAYAAAKVAGGDGKSISPMPIADAVAKMRPDFLASNEGTSLLNGFKAKLEQFGAANFSGEKPAFKPITVNDAEGVRKWLNNVRDPSNPSQARLVDMLKGSVDDAVLSSGKGGIYDEARFARQLKGLTYEDPKLIDNLTKMTTRTDPKIDYEDVAHQIINRGSTDDLKNLRNTLTTPAMADTEAPAMGQKAWNDLRANVLSGALTKATKYGGPNEAGQQQFSGIQFKKALDDVGMDKLRVLFNRDELGMLGAIQRSGVNLTTAAPGAINNSNTTSAVRNMVEQIYGSTQAPEPGNAAKALKFGVGLIPGGGSALKYGGAIAEVAKNQMAGDVLSKQAMGAASPQKAIADLLARESTVKNGTDISGINNVLAGRLAAIISSQNNRPDLRGK